MHPVERLDGVLITHEHGDHYIGLDDPSSFKRTRPRGEFTPYPVPPHHTQWQETVDRVVADDGLPVRISVAHDDLVVPL